MSYNKRLFNNVKYIYMYTFFHCLIFAYVIERLFWRSRGISVVETVYLEAIYAVTIAILEVPSGFWADIWRRKDLIILSQILSVLEIMILIFAKSFFMFALVMVVAAISGALRSGSTNALIYDTLIEVERENEFEKVIGRVKAFGYSSHMIAALMGGFLAHEYGLIINYKVSIISGLISLSMAIFLTEPSITTSSVTKDDLVSDKVKTLNRFLDIFKNAYSVITKNSYLYYIVVVAVIVGSTMTYLWEFWQNYIESIGIKIIYFGVVSGACSLGVIISAARAYIVIGLVEQNAIDKKKLYQVSMLVIGVCFILMFYVRNIISIILMILINIVAGVFEVAIEGDIHHSIESDYRATFESIYSMLLRIISIGIGVVFGLVVDHINIFLGFGALGFIILVSLFIANTLE